MNWYSKNKYNGSSSFEANRSLAQIWQLNSTYHEVISLPIIFRKKAYGLGSTLSAIRFRFVALNMEDLSSSEIGVLVNGWKGVETLNMISSDQSDMSEKEMNSDIHLVNFGR